MLYYRVIGNNVVGEIELGGTNAIAMPEEIGGSEHYLVAARTVESAGGFSGLGLIDTMDEV